MQKRIAIIDREACNPNVCGGWLCMRVCPVNRTGKECITKSPVDTKPLINEELCIGCGICVKKCPKNAIAVVNLPQKLEETPIHRYGQNAFMLYRLPIPQKGAVVGLIGPNGVGKSTVLSILSGQMKPNTGILKGVDWPLIIERFKGTELQAYVEGLAEKKMRVAYKPQSVDAIPKMWKGAAKDLLKKADERGQMDAVVSGLGLKEALGKEIANLSGGELQMLAIAATVLKRADLYFFDEPSSYLDVSQRLRAAKVIRSLSEKAPVMVVEHDLAVADYLADYVHMLYGQPGVFGIVSKPYGVRVGINSFLEGYIKEENVRFRPEPIIFGKEARANEKMRVFMDWPGFGKEFKGFSLSTEPGKMHKGEIIGIIGPNAIGKTTFIKMLAGELKPDKPADWKSGLSVAYKPQRIVLEDDKKELTVDDYLSDKDIAGGDRSRIGRVLNLERLYERRLGTLSGGELQTVLIAKTLMQKSDLLLLDEPSAFLDVEQRLNVARLLRQHVESTEVPCFVVDHDLLFLDSISDRLMVFEGKPGVDGNAKSPESLRDGMNRFLKKLNITFRRDAATGRPRANKPGSQKDAEQKESGEYYYL